MDTSKHFELAGADDADGLMAALAGAPATSAIRNDAGESLYAFSVFRGRTKCAEALKKRGGLYLHDAALAGEPARVEALLAQAPWAIDMLSPDGWTALHLACFVGNDTVVAALLARGVDPLVMSRAFEQNLALHAAAAGRRIGRDTYRGLIRATGPDRLQKQGYSALMIAASNGFADGIEALLAEGADKTLALPDSKTAADIAKDRGFPDLEKRLR